MHTLGSWRHSSSSRSATLRLCARITDVRIESKSVAPTIGFKNIRRLNTACSIDLQGRDGRANEREPAKARIDDKTNFPEIQYSLQYPRSDSGHVAI